MTELECRVLALEIKVEELRKASQRDKFIPTEAEVKDYIFTTKEVK